MNSNFRTLQDFFRSVGLPLEQDMEFTVHRLEGLHGDKPMESPLFRTDYYSFLLITSGKSSYQIDNQRFDLGRFSFYFTNPGHLKSFKIEEPLGGYMLTFSERFIQNNFAGDFFTQFPFLIHETTPVMTLDTPLCAGIATIFEQMLVEYRRQSPFRAPILSNLLSFLLFRTKELLLTHRALIVAPNRGAELVGAFKKSVNDNFKDLADQTASRIWSVKEHAARLNVHPNYLTNLVKDQTGKPASEWIQERALTEAQSLLKNTGRTISEIAFTLGFSDSAHFAKFFKKHTGLTPSAFRK